MEAARLKALKQAKAAAEAKAAAAAKAAEEAKVVKMADNHDLERAGSAAVKHAAATAELAAITAGMKAGLWTRAAAERRRELEKKLRLAMRAKAAFGAGKLPTAHIVDVTRGRPSSATAQRLQDARRRDALLNTQVASK